jgi:hypothetical protein
MAAVEVRPGAGGDQVAPPQVETALAAVAQARIEAIVGRSVGAAAG